MQTEPESHQRSSLILLVDDEQNILSSLGRLLEEENYSVITASSGQNGLEVLEQQAVDLIISDMRMPNMDGATFLKTAAQKWPDTVRILLTGFSDMQSTIQAVNEGKIYHYFTKPWNDDELLRGIRDALELKYLRDYARQLERIRNEQNVRLLELTEQQEETIRRRTAELEQTAQQLDTAYQELQETYYQTVPLLGHLIELNERVKKHHSMRVAKVSEMIARQMALSDHDIRQCCFGAALHDVGKIGVEASILGKSVLNMTPLELMRYQQHPVLGESALLSYDPLKEAAQIIRCHHERYDGKGFPGKLAGANIPLGARIVAVANDYDNLQLHHNFLGKTLTDMQAKAYILSESGKRYDPTVVSAFEVIYEDIRTLLAQRDEVILPVEKLKPGMKLSQDLVNQSGLVMLAAGKVLSDVHIAKLKQFESTFKTRLQIVVVHTAETAAPPSPETPPAPAGS